MTETEKSRNNIAVKSGFMKQEYADLYNGIIDEAIERIKEIE